MAFLIHEVEGGYIPSWEYPPCSAITPKVGMALYQNAGNLALASGTTMPTHISMTERESALTASRTAGRTPPPRCKPRETSKGGPRRALRGPPSLLKKVTSAQETEDV